MKTPSPRTLNATQQARLADHLSAMRAALSGSDDAYVDFAQRLLSIYDRDDYAPWGSIEEFARAEFDLGRQRCYELLNYGRFLETWGEQDWTPTERQFRRVVHQVDPRDWVRVFREIQARAVAEKRAPLVEDIETIVPPARPRPSRRPPPREPVGAMETGDRFAQTLLAEKEPEGAVVNLYVAEQAVTAALERVGSLCSPVIAAKYGYAIELLFGKLMLELDGHAQEAQVCSSAA